MNRLLRSSDLFFNLRALFLGLGLLTLLSWLPAAPVHAEGDHGGSCATASFLPLGTTLAATHEPQLDRDLFRLDVPTPGIVTLEIASDGSRDPRLRLRGRDCEGGEAIRYVERTDLRQAFVVAEPGSYYVEVVGHGARHGSPYTLRSAFAADRDAADWVVEIPADPLDACSALSADQPSFGVKSIDTDELDPVVPVPPPTLAPGGGFILVPLQHQEPQIGVKSIDTDELDPVVSVPPPRLTGEKSSNVVVLTESIEALDTDVVVLRMSGDGYFVIDAEGAAIAGSLFAGSSCRPAAQVASGVRLDRAGALIVPAGDYVLRLEPEPEAAGRYWLRIKHLVAAGR